jgi:hypothetical protein
MAGPTVFKINIPKGDTLRVVLPDFGAVNNATCSRTWDDLPSIEIETLERDAAGGERWTSANNHRLALKIIALVMFYVSTRTVIKGSINAIGALKYTPDRGWIIEGPP